ncbi:MAG: hypothetical protein R3246_11020 [Acidimicrobiia bacterium]|nr:hypothetical protein [Acidimicrobiia bacterium]
MTEDRIRELMTSPLAEGGTRRLRHSDDEDPPRTSGSGLGPWIVAAVLAGGALAYLGYLAAGGGDEPAPTSVATPTTTAAPTTTIAPAGALPPGYTQAGLYGVRVERILLRTDTILVTVSSVVPNTLDGAVSSPFEGGRWALELADGSILESTAQAVDATVPGFVTVRFPMDGGPTPAAEDIVGFRLTGTGLRTFAGLDATAELQLVPDQEATAPLTGSFALDQGVTLELSPLTATFDGFQFEWALGGTAEAVGVLHPTLEVSVGESTILTGPEGQGGGFGFFSGFTSTPATSSGQFTFIGVEELGMATPADGEVIVSIRLDLGVSWTVFEPTDVELPLDGVPIARAG